MLKLKSLGLVALLITSYSAISEPQCHPRVDTHKVQMMVGYGSLMQEASKKRSDPNVSINYPVMLSGFQRGWFLNGCTGINKFSTTYLGIIPKRNGHLNAVIYALDNAKGMPDYDQREFGYCRVEVAKKQIKYLAKMPKKFSNAQIWVYVSKPQNVKQPTKSCPLVQSYVDIFISGCLELQAKYKLPNFTKECIRSTSGWSHAWVNDRIYPRRPFIYQPMASKIDKALNEYLPEYYQHIKLA